MVKINETISKAKDDVKELIMQAHGKQLEAEPGRTMMESFENRVNQVLLDCLALFCLLKKKNLPFLHFVELQLANLPFLHARFLTRLVMMLEVVPRRVCLKATT